MNKIHISRSQLEDLYIRRGFSQAEIGRRLNVSPKTVGRRLREENIDIRAAGESIMSRAELKDLYCSQGLTMEQIATRFGRSVAWVQDALKRHGIPSRPRGMDRHHRRDLPVDDIVRLYVDEEWSAAAVGRKLGISTPLVLRTLHSQGHPVRRRGPRSKDSRDDVELIKELYADKLVCKVIDKHGIPRRRAGRSLVERFPKPIPLTSQALKDLYLQAGLSSDHIELLTGQPRMRVRRWLRSAGVPLRLPGDAAPALRRIWNLE